MKFFKLLIVFFVFVSPAYAAMMEYEDDAGKIWYANRIESVPEKYRDQLNDKVRPLKQKRQNRPGPVNQNLGDSSSDPAELDKQDEGVAVFIKPNCVKCVILENFLKAHQIKYRKYDVENDPEAQALVEQLGIREIPSTRIGTEIVRGFAPQEILGAFRK